MSQQEHWEKVYQTKSTDAVSWFQPHAEKSLALIDSCQLSPDASIIDVGAGASLLVDDLLARGYVDISLLDISQTALQITKDRLQEKSSSIQYLVGDITQASLPVNHFHLWHDRAVFHFLTEKSARDAYKNNLLLSLKDKGLLVISTFAQNGPEKCSNLQVARYSAESLYAEFSEAFDLIATDAEAHQTPFNTTQEFVYCVMKKK